MNLCDVEMLGYFFKFYEFTENYLLVRFHTIDIKFSRRFPCRVYETTYVTIQKENPFRTKNV